MPKYPYRILGTFFDRVFRNNLNDNFKDVEADIKTQKNRVDTLINETEQPSEVVDARTDKDGNVYTVLKDRLDSEQQSNETQFTDTGLRIDDLEAELADNSVTLTIQHGLNVIASDRNTPLFMRKLIGKTVINHVPLFDSGLWVLDSGYTVDSPSKLTLDVSSSTYHNASVYLTLKPNTPYIFNCDIGGEANANIREGHNLSGTAIATETSPTFTSPSDGKVTMRLYNKAGANGTYTFERPQINEGSTLQEFTSNVRGVTNPVLFSYGKNLIKPFTEWDTIHANATIISPYELELTATSNFENSYVDIPVIEGQTYTISDQNTNGYVYLKFLDNDKNITGEWGGSGGADSNSTDTIPSGVKFVRVQINNAQETGTFSFKNIQLELGSTATSFKEYNASYQVLKCIFYEGDQLTWNENGEPVKLADKKEVALDGSLDWAFRADHTGYKRVQTDVSNVNNNYIKSVKYDGSILDTNSSASNGDQIYYDNVESRFILTISDSDSGWGEDTSAWTTTMWDYMIPAYFNGWKYIGSNTWESIYDSSITTSDTEEIRSRNLHEENGKEGYRLIYELAEKETITLGTDDYEGSLQLHEGDNQVELTEGLVVREVANPEYNSNFDRYDINSGSSHVTDNQLLNYSYISNVLSVYKNGKVDGNWYKQGNKYGYELLCDAENFDPQATYTVTYFALPYQLTSETPSADVEYAQNLNSTVNQLVKSNTDNERKITVLDEQKASKHQEGWIDPILVNGHSEASSTSQGFYKDDFGVVHVSIRITVGTGSNGTPVFYLPKGYEIAGGQDRFPLIARNNNNATVVSCYVNKNIVVLGETVTSGKDLSITGSFRAEQ